MGYQLALEKAGCNVIAFKEFGSYQGEWLAFVEYNGEKGMVEGSYGSCTGCDAFQATFSYRDEPEEVDGKYYLNGRTWDDDDLGTKEQFEEKQKEYHTRLAEFGADYLKPGLYKKEHYQNKIENLDNEDWFDSETKEICEWALTQDW